MGYAITKKGKGSEAPQDLPKKGREDRRPISERTHEMYFESDKWEVIDIDLVDRLNVFETVGTNDQGDIRIDLDGVDVSRSDQIGEQGKNINLSIWFNIDKILSDEFLEELEKTVRKAFEKKYSNKTKGPDKIEGRPG